MTTYQATGDLNLAPPMPRSYGYVVVSAIYTYVGGIGGSIVLGLFFKALSDSWAWAVAGVAAGVLLVLCLVPLTMVGYMQRLQQMSRIVPVKEPEPAATP